MVINVISFSNLVINYFDVVTGRGEYSIYILCHLDQKSTNFTVVYHMFSCSLPITGPSPTLFPLSLAEDGF